MMALRNNVLVQQNPQLLLQPEAELQLTRLMIERTADAAFWVGSDARFVYVNDAACRSVEYSRAELLSMTTHDIDLDLPQRVWLKHWQTLKQQGSLIFASRHRAKGGRVFSVELSATYMEFQGRGYSCAFARDFTRRQQGEAALETHAVLSTARLEEQDTLRQRWAAESQQTSEPPAAKTTRAAAPRSIFPASSQFAEVFDFIEANYHQPIGLCDVAEAVGYSSAYLTDLVHRQTGQPVNRWIAERRMAAARSLLLETKQTVNQIAEAVGYQHEGHFFRQFRQYHGTTPQAWRNEQRI